MLWDSWWPVLLDQLEMDNNVLLWYKSGNCLINCSMPTFLGARICLGSMGEMLILQGDVVPVENPCWLAWSWNAGMKDLPKICPLSVCSSALHQQLCSCGGFYSELFSAELTSCDLYSQDSPWLHCGFRQDFLGLSPQAALQMFSLAPVWGSEGVFCVFWAHRV